LVLEGRVVHDDLAVDELRAGRPVAAKELLDAQPRPDGHEEILPTAYDTDPAPEAD